DDFERTLALNFGAVWHLSRAAAKPMIEQGKGAIVNISSGASLLSMPQAAPYAAAKAAVNNLTGSMAAAWARKGIRVNSIALGAVRAATLTDDAARHGLDPEAVAMTNGLGRLGEPDEIGYGVLFFASDASSFCSGQTLYMHGAPGPAGVFNDAGRRGDPGGGWPGGKQFTGFWARRAAGRLNPSPSPRCRDRRFWSCGGGGRDVARGKG